MEREMVVPIAGRNPNGGTDTSSDSTMAMPYQKSYSIFKVPTYIADRNPKSYAPNVVSIGPYHYGQSHLTTMEEHKERALEHFLRRFHKSYQDLSNELRKLLPSLRGSYQQLGNAWNDNEKFLRLMIQDGAFLYEYMKCFSEDSNEPTNYGRHDPVFGYYALLSAYPSIIQDIIMIENQLPLMVLERLIAVETNRVDEKHFAKVYKLVFKILGRTRATSEESAAAPLEETTPYLHVLDVAREAITKDARLRLSSDTNREPATQVLSASDLSDVGLTFAVSNVQGTSEIAFEPHHTLCLAPLYIDTLTKPLFLNSIAFEQLCHSVGRQVSSYIAFMSGLIRTPADVGLLRSKNLISGRIGDDDVANVMSTISETVFFDPYSNLCKVRDALNAYHKSKMKGLRPRIRKWMRKLKQKYFDNPWTTISVNAATALLGLTIIQTVYTMLGYYKGNGNTFPTAVVTAHG